MRQKKISTIENEIEKNIDYRKSKNRKNRL